MKKIIMLSAVLSVGTVAHAQSSYVAPLNAGLGNGAAVSCSACHSGTATENNATLPMAGTWRSGAHLALSDTDGDGFNNAQEVDGGSTNFNLNTVSPFSLAKAVESSTSPNVVVATGGIVTETPITDVYAQAGITLAAGHSIAGGVSPLVNNFPATITFNKAVNTGDTVYVVDLVNKTSTPVPVQDVVFNANGSVTVSGLTGPANLVVDRATPVVPAAGAARGESEGFECVTGQLSTPLLMFFAMLMLGFMVKRKRS
ncbi:MAG: thrombospondin type 3 repeat-containing protein [Ghiorsea sp.]|nr:thrombospondin type 3 repeat-containing protein [Ghiorsea sp.]